MPFDLSQVGLTGIHQANETLQTRSEAAFRAEQTRALELDNQKAGLENDLDAEVAQQMNRIALGNGGTSSGNVAGTGGTRADNLRFAGDIYTRGGAIKRGLDYYKAAGDMDETENKLENDELNREQTRLENHAKTADIVTRTLGSATTQKEWQSGLDYILNSPAFTETEKAHIAALPAEYDPDVVASLNESALTAYQRATLGIQGANQKRAESALAESTRFRERMAAISEARQAETVRQNDLKDRSGKSAISPSEIQVSNAKKLIQSQIFGSTPVGDKAALSAGAVSIATRANAIVQLNKGITYDVALNQAIIESQAAGDWPDVKGEEHLLGNDPDSKTFKKQNNGKSPERALPIPAVKTALKAGKYYVTSRGVARWNGQSFEQ